ncbi:hypothetical protein H0H93_008082, partial [Arthromyces matolae]
LSQSFHPLPKSNEVLLAIPRVYKLQLHQNFKFHLLAVVEANDESPHVACSLFNACASVRGGPIPALNPTEADVDDACMDATQIYRLDDCSDVEWSTLFDEHIPLVEDPGHVVPQPPTHPGVVSSQHSKPQITSNGRLEQSQSHAGVSSPQAQPSSHSIDNYFNADCSDFSRIMMDDTSSPQGHRSHFSQGTSNVGWGSTIIPNPQSPSATRDTWQPYHMFPVESKRKHGNEDWQDQELEDTKKRAEVQTFFDIWKAKYPERFKAFLKSLREKEIALRDLDLQDSEVKTSLLQYHRDFMEKVWRQSHRQQEEAIKLLKKNKDIEDEDVRAKVEEEVMAWKESLRKSRKEFNVLECGVRQRRRVLLDLQLSPRERTTLELVYMRDAMRRKQNEGHIRDRRHKAVLKTLRENEDLKDKNVQAAVEAKFTQWKKNLRAKDHKRFRGVSRNLRREKERIESKEFQLDEDKKRILEIAYMRDMML